MEIITQRKLTGIMAGESVNSKQRIEEIFRVWNFFFLLLLQVDDKQSVVLQVRPHVVIPPIISPIGKGIIYMHSTGK